MTISLPFKILLFVMIDGWNLLVSSIVRSSTIDATFQMPDSELSPVQSQEATCLMRWSWESSARRLKWRRW